MKSSLFVDQLDSTRSLLPEERLMIAVVEQAYYSFFGTNGPRERVSADRWFFSDVQDYCFSFVYICEHFGWSVAAIRQRLNPARLRYTTTMPEKKVRIRREIVVRKDIKITPKRKRVSKALSTSIRQIESIHKTTQKTDVSSSDFSTRALALLKHFRGTEEMGEAELCILYAGCDRPTASNQTFVYGALCFLEQNHHVVKVGESRWKLVRKGV